MNTDDPFDQDEAFALEAYAALPRSQPTPAIDARILAAAGAVNATRRPRRWTTGLATAAVAVLAVGLAWRGLDTAQPDYAPRKVQQVVPTMQPAFKLETAPPAAKELGNARDDVRARAAAPQTAAAPAMSTTDWKAPRSVPRNPERDSKPNTQAVPETELQVAPVFDEPLPMSEPAPAPPAPPAPPAAEQLSESVSVDNEARSSQSVEQSSQSDNSTYRSEPAPSTQAMDQEVSAEAFDATESQNAGAARQELDESKPSRSSSARAALSGAAALDAKADAAKRERLSEPGAESAQSGSLNSVAPVTMRSIRDGNTPYVEAIAAARAARVRGDVATARHLVSAIAARFGQRRLPSDLRELVSR